MNKRLFTKRMAVLGLVSALAVGGMWVGSRAVGGMWVGTTKQVAAVGGMWVGSGETRTIAN